MYSFIDTRISLATGISTPVPIGLSTDELPSDFTLPADELVSTMPFDYHSFNKQLFYNCCSNASYNWLNECSAKKWQEVLFITQKLALPTHPFNGPFSGTIRVSRYQKGKTYLDFTEARDSEWQWHQLGHIQVCTSLQADNHASTPPLVFLQAGCPSCRPTNSVKALKATAKSTVLNQN